MGRPDDYVANDGCWNCKLVFRRSDFEEGVIHYCHQDESKRPLCDSHSMGESFVNYLRQTGIVNRDTDAETFCAELDKLKNLWDVWAEDHKVICSGYCTWHKPL